MLRDGRSLTDGETIETDVCIIGSGPVGLTIASELLGSGRQVTVLETGGDEPEPDLQRLAQGEVVGDPLLDTSVVRHRRIGGNANAWVVKLADGRFGVRYAELERHDFEPRAWIPHSGWPFGLDDLRPYYARAAATCDCGPPSYDPGEWSAPDARPWELDPASASTRVFRFGPRRAFTEELRGSVESDPTATILHHATAVELVLGASGRSVDTVVCRHLDGRQFTVRARRFVLAMGGLENARLLLMSNRRVPTGIGNGNDLVGRFLQDHPIVAGGSLTLSDQTQWARCGFYDMRLMSDVSVLGHLSLGSVAQARLGALGLSASFFPRPSTRRSIGLEAMKQLVERRSAGLVSGRQAVRYGARVAVGADYLAIAAVRKFRWNQSLYPGFGRGGWSTMPDLHRKFRRFEIVHQAEQSPNPDNRVTLSRDVDALGCPKLRVEWRFSRSDSEAAHRGRRVIADAIERAGIGKVELPDDGGLPEFGRAAGTAHHIGTTRMHDDPAHGVTDRDGRLHEVDNVHLAGSSLFPTGGYANPTFTAVALAHRLADRLRVD